MATLRKKGERESNLVDIKYYSIVHETSLAWLIAFNREDDPKWIPKSLCEVDEPTKTLTLEENIAVDKEIEKYA